MFNHTYVGLKTFAPVKCSSLSYSGAMSDSFLFMIRGSVRWSFRQLDTFGEKAVVLFGTTRRGHVCVRPCLSNAFELSTEQALEARCLFVGFV